VFFVGPSSAFKKKKKKLFFKKRTISAPGPDRSTASTSSIADPSRVPNVTNLTSPPLVTVRVGSPLSMVGDDPQSDTVRIMEAIMGLLPAESRQWREPTTEEIRRATPAGLSPEG
jgi:hypothetical protein